jgi:DNA-binding beta-propeller fold protein YncE
VDATDTIYVADTDSSVIRIITSESASCKVATLAGNGTRSDLDGTGTNATFYFPNGLTLDVSGTLLYVSDTYNNKIRRATLAGGVVTLAGPDQGKTNAGYANGSLSNATFTKPLGIALDTNTETLYVSEAHHIRKIKNGTVSLLAGSNVGANGFVDATGDSARFDAPYGLALDTEGNLYVTDCGNHAVRKISPDGEVTTFAGKRDGVMGAGVDGAEDGPANQATFHCPYGIAVDNATGVVYVSDYGNNNIRKITPVY